jgi:outer membrane protein OmpA-like peptidoglycan-associated protein
MWKPRPGKWLLWAPPMVALTTLAAHVLNSGTLYKDISARTTEHLFAVGANWAVPTFDGRDVTLNGDAPSQQAIDSAVKAVAGTYGVRTVTSGARVVVPLPPAALLAPTIKPLTANNPTPEIKGLWQEDIAKTLAVTLAGRTFEFGTDPELSSNAGDWSLKPLAPLADGGYDVSAEVSDGTNPPVGTTTPTRISIDTVAPPAPVITPLSPGIQWPFTLNGTWAEDGATSLVAKLADQTWTLGKNEDLKSDGKGNWSFAPVVDLRPGTYDVTLETSDLAGNISKTTLGSAIVIPEQATPTAAAIPAPVTAIMAEPTLKSATIMEARPTLAGTWPEGAAAGLSVTLAGRTYALGTDAALSSDGAGNWKLKSESVLKDGAYDIVVETTNTTGKTLAITSKITVDAAAPATPTVSLYANDTTPSEIKGTWAEGDATSLKVSVPQAGLEAAWDDGSGTLVTDGKGNWSFAISKIFEPGSYDVIVETADKVGRKSFDQTRFEVNIKALANDAPAVASAPAVAPVPAAAPSPQAPASSPPYDCAGVLGKISAIFPIRFAFNNAQLIPPLDVAMNQYAALLKDTRCVTMKAEIAGHTDFFGPRLYNQVLSEARAQTVVTALAAAGVDASRLSTEGYSESVPLDAEKSIAARIKNRRVEITLVK